MQVTREKGALLAALKGIKRLELHNLCKIHNIKVTKVTNQVLERSIAEHCVTEHIGRVVVLDKCSKAANAAASSRKDTAVPSSAAAVTVAAADAAAPLHPRALVPQKRAIDTAAGATDETAKRRPAEAPLRSSASSSTAAAAPTLRSLQHALDELTRRLDRAPTPASLSPSDVDEMIEARLASHREELHAALLDLRELCSVGFTNMQASFDAVGTWRDEVTATFTQINRWAADVEEKLLPPPASVNSQQQHQHQLDIISRTPATALPRHVLSEQRRPPPSALSQLSSTPASHLAQMQRLPCQTPALPPIHASRRRSGRMSDASEFSLATIPEQTGGCAEGEEEEEEVAEQGEKEDQVRQAGRLSPAAAAAPTGHFDAVPLPAPTAGAREAEAVRRSPRKHVRIASPPLSSPVPAHRRHTASASSVSPFRTSTSIASPRRCPPALDTIGQPARTPAASKTLFGTECSTEERFDDAAPVDEASRHALGTGLPTWTQRSPSCFRRAGAC